MPFLRKSNPYNAGYAIPEVTLHEGAHAKVSRGLPRRSVSPTSPLAKPWKTGYDYPPTLEPPGVAPRVTKYTPRGTIFDYVPNQLEGVDDMDNGSLGDGMTPHGILSSRDGRGSLGSTDGIFGRGPRHRYGSLGAAGGSSNLGKDPIAAFGREGALIVLRSVRNLPDLEQRKAALRAILDGVSPGLWASVDAKAAKLIKEKRYDAQTALEKAIAMEFANRYLDQIIKLGQGSSVPSRGPLALAHASGLGACTEATLQGLGALTADAQKLVASGKAKPCTCSSGKESIKLTFGPVQSCMCDSGGGFLSSVTSIVTAPVTMTASAGAKVASTAVDGLKKLSELACAVGTSSQLKGAVTVAASVKAGTTGAKAAAKGADIASKVCGSSAPAAEAYVPPPAPAKSGFPLVPVLIGGGVLAVVLLLKKKG